MRRFFGSTIGAVDNPFIFTVNTANTSTGSTTNTEFKLPLRNSGTFDFTVDWGDSTSDVITAWDQAEVTHNYGSTDIYTITITGQIRGFSFLSTGDRLKITDISQWGTTTFIANGVTTNGSFRLCTNLNVTATDKPTFEVGNQVAFFESCSSLVYNLSINDWDFSPITGSINRFFLNCPNFNQPIGNWDVSNVTNFSVLFQSCTAFNQNLSSWNVSEGTIFHSMFKSCSNFNNGGDAGINDWIVSKGIEFGGTNQGMFESATAFNQPIGSWNVSDSTSIRQMFRNAAAFNQPIGGWNVGNVTSFRSVFQNATAFNQPIGGWNVSKALDLDLFMAGKTDANYSAANLDAIYNGWSLLTFVNTGLTINFGTIKYTAGGQAGKDILEASPNNWDITDGGI